MLTITHRTIEWCQCKLNVGEKASLVPRMLKVIHTGVGFGSETIGQYVSQKVERSLRIM